MSLFEAALLELSGLPIKRVRGLADDWNSAGFAALYRKAGLPEKLLPAFRGALEAMRVCGHDYPGSARLSRQMVERVLTACETAQGGSFEDKLFVVLRRFEAEAAREEARFDAPTFLEEEITSSAPVVVVDAAYAQDALEAMQAEVVRDILDLSDVLDDVLASETLEREALEPSFLALSGGDEFVQSFAPVIDMRSEIEPPQSSVVIDFDALEAELMAA
jgi:hypothetical protein